MNEPPDQVEAERRRAAQYWIARLASREMTLEERRTFRAWYDTSTTNVEAFQRARVQWHQLERTRVVFEQVIARDKQRVQRRRMILAPLAGAAASIFLFFLATGHSFTSLMATHATRVAEIRQIDLPDGSHAWLNSDSAIDVTFDVAERRIRLLKGEVWFDVRRAPERPFVVEAGNVQAVAKGTAFSVTRGDQGVSVEVTHGVVAVSGDGIAAVELTAGRGVDVSSSRVESVHSFSETDALAWRQRKISIEDLSLEQAIAEIDRYRPGRIFLWGEGAKQPVSAVLEFDSLDEGLGAIAANHGLSVMQLTPWLAIVR